jgi:hypothetical protein
MMPVILRAVVAIVLTFGIAAALAQSASAAAKHKHHSTKPKVEYLRSAAPASGTTQK